MRARHLVLLLALLGPGTGTAPQARAETIPDVARRDLTIINGDSEIVDLRRPATEVTVSNPNVAEVYMPTERRLIITGRSVGNANIMALDAKGQIISRINAQVNIDDVALRRTLQRILPGEQVEVQTVNRDVMILGEVSSPAAAEQIRLIARRFVAEDTNLIDMLKVRGDQQVLLKVRVYEVKSQLLKELGFSYGGVLDSTGTRELGGGLFSTGNLGLTTEPLVSAGLGNAYANGGLGGTFLRLNERQNALLIGLDALQRTGEVRLLAEPNLTALSGERATFHAGSEFYITIDSGDDDAGPRLEPRDLGVKVSFEPVVMGADRLRLHLATEVANLSEENNASFSVNNSVIQGRSLRRAETTVELPSGGTLMIAGLLQSDGVKGRSGLPGLSDLPLVGDATSSDRVEIIETELLVLVTAVLVQPFGDQGLAKLSPSPNTDPVATQALQSLAVQPLAAEPLPATMPAMQPAPDMAAADAADEDRPIALQPVAASAPASGAPDPNAPGVVMTPSRALPPPEVASAPAAPASSLDSLAVPVSLPAAAVAPAAEGSRLLRGSGFILD